MILIIAINVNLFQMIGRDLYLVSHQTSSHSVERKEKSVTIKICPRKDD